MNSGLRDKAMMAVLGTVVLYALAAATWFFYAESAWKKSSMNW